ncbi:31279_t:CDS:2 [Gigaspora margarita]|uniref:GrpE protein homolog, mitochondrial n=1 Tax=Gigaspora margarita TaxID=4874 RepID=A0ABM8W1D7_GIGMA|nr:31279_t:CDS:2 [Gigaspora margarita]
MDQQKETEKEISEPEVKVEKTERERELEAEITRLREEKLHFLEDLERALKFMQKSPEIAVKNHLLPLEMIKSKVEKNLANEGVKEIKIEPKKDQLNSYYHEVAAEEENTELAPKTILEVVKKGYLLRDQVLKVSQGKNRQFFIQKLVANLGKAIKKNVFYSLKIRQFYDQLIITGQEEEQLTNFFPHLEKIFGISVFYLTYYLPSDLTKLHQFAENLADYYPIEFRSFKLDIKRNDKSFAETSAGLREKLGSKIKNKYNLKVDLTSPEKIFYIRIYRQFILFFTERKKGLGGLPVGSTGQVLLLLSGGIDSPVAAYQLMKRGCEVIYLHFYYQTEGQEKILALGEKLQPYNNYSQTTYLVNFQPFLTEIRHISQEKYRLIILKRMFVRLANRLAEKLTIPALASGDCLAQVSSQTLESLAVIYQINTYNLSCQKYSDCCALFEPRRPVTKPKKEIVEKLEKEIW